MKKSQKKNQEFFKKLKIEKVKEYDWITKFVSKNDKLVRIFMYPKVKFSFYNKMLNEENIYYDYNSDCSEEDVQNYNNYFTERLIAGLAPMAVIKDFSLPFSLRFQDRIDFNEFSYNYFSPTNERFIYKKGKIGELFDLDALTEDYQKCGIKVNVKQYQDLDIFDVYLKFHTEELYLDAKTSKCIIDLIFGFPIENTIAMMYERQLDDEKYYLYIL